MAHIFTKEAPDYAFFNIDLKLLTMHAVNY